ncbi:SLC13 family permease [cyanobiont of Ornithocercus magnificus]|nr:SLC13 family permease [cyanobiont of Ornithocercus magnificus]
MVMLYVVQEQGPALITLAVLGLAVFLFVSGALAPELTGLLSVALLMAAGVLHPVEALAGFGSPALITLLGLFVVSEGLFRSGALDRLRGLLSSEQIRSPKHLILLLVLVVGPISGLVPNTPVVATLLPIVEGWCRRHDISPSKVLLPLSFATVLGGTLTLLGSSVNLLASDISEQLGHGSLKLLSPTTIGFPVWLIGSLYLILAPSRLLPDRGCGQVDLASDPNRASYLTEVNIPYDSELVGTSLRHSRLQRRFDVDILELQRDNKRFFPPLVDQHLVAGDRLLIRVTRADLLRLQQEHTVNLVNRNDASIKTTWRDNNQAESQKTVEVLLPAGSTLAGASLRELRFHQRHNATVLALRRGQHTLQERLGKVVLREGDVLLLRAPLDSVLGLQADNDLLMLDQIENDLPLVRRKFTAIIIAALMLLLPSLTDIPLVASVLIALVAMVLGGCLRAGEVQQAIRLDVILLLGSLSCFSTALQTSGLADVLVTYLQRWIATWPTYGALLVIFLGTTLLTEVMSNAASVALLIPVVVGLAESLNLPPIAMLLTVLFGASQSFLTPMGYQTHLMVFGPGRYRFLDVFRYGLGLTLLMTLLVPALILWRYRR